MSTSNPSRILIIDNDEGMVRAIVTRLESSGYECIEANTGAQGLAAFRDADVDLVITDLNMPAGDGAAVATAIRRISEVPIIFVTGFRDDYDSALRDITGVTILDKPFASSDLVDLVDTELALA